MLIGIKIEKLFDTFDYDIEFKNEGITIITGPNGYGKTTVLKIIDAIATQNAVYFLMLIFKKITFNFLNTYWICLEKININDVSVTSNVNWVDNNNQSINWINNEQEIVDWTNSEKIWRRLNIVNFLLKSRSVIFTEDGFWLDLDTHKRFSTEFFFNKDLLSNENLSNIFPKLNFLNMPKVYFIQEQRLLRPVIKSNKKLEVLNDKNIELFTLQPYEQGSFSNTIEIYAIELSQIFKEKLAESSKINQELDSSFPRRLFDQKDGISEKEFKQRFDQVKKIQKALSEFGLLDIEEDSHPTYKSENANALSVYINDIERKMAVYTEILDKLKVFTNILNERRFTFKRIHISAKDGFKFATDKGQFLELADLSSGEQQEVVMLYELLFKVQPGTLVLVDEPELSLHVVWQKEFLDDLFQILKLQDIQIIIATHSPQIINNHWNLTVDLEDLNCASTSQ